LCDGQHWWSEIKTDDASVVSEVWSDLLGEKPGSARQIQYTVAR
jgi:hypothetical protein